MSRFSLEINQTFDKLYEIETRVERSHDRLFDLLNPDILSTWHSLNLLLKKFLLAYDEKKLEDILDLNQFNLKHLKHYRDMNFLFQNELEKLRKNDIILNPEDVDFLHKKGEVISFYEHQSDAIDLFNTYYECNDLCNKNAESDVIPALSSVRDRLRKVLLNSYYIWSMFSNWWFTQSTEVNEMSRYYCEVLNKHVRAFCRFNYNDEFNLLRAKVQDLKMNDINLQATDLWWNIYKTQFEAIKKNIERLEKSDNRKEKEIYSSCFYLLMRNSLDGNLFDVVTSSPDSIHALNVQSLRIFLEYVLRFNIIQCQLHPELDAKFKNWLKEDVEAASKKSPTTATHQQINQIQLTTEDQKLLDTIHGYIEKVDWKTPATNNNIKEMIYNLFHTNDDFRAFFKNGRGNREIVSTANTIGWLLGKGLVNGTPQKIALNIFKDKKQENNINKGKNEEASQAFKDLIPTLNTEIQKILV